jgi:predicted peptidase
MYQKLKGINKTAALILFPDDNHNSWDSTYSNLKFYEWLLAQHK